MYLIRPVALDDVPALLELAQLTSFGLTTLPRDLALLQRRVRQSLRSFARGDDEPPRGENYLFVIENTDNHRALGTAGIVAKVGGFEPFYAFQIKTSVHESRMLNIHKEIQTLNLVTEHNGPCEIGSLFLHPRARASGNGRTLSLARFLFMANFPSRFDPVVIAEMRGVIDDRGRSAFWDAVGKHFFDLDFPKADYLSIVDKQFIGELMPVYPIYLPLLPASAQAVVGKTHDNTAPALRILQDEGFRITDMVDIFEAGPIVQCPLADIRTVAEADVATLDTLVDDITTLDSSPYIVANLSMAFRACQSQLRQLDTDCVALPGEVSQALRVNRGDRVRLVPLYPSHRAATARSQP